MSVDWPWMFVISGNSGSWHEACSRFSSVTCLRMSRTLARCCLSWKLSGRGILLILLSLLEHTGLGSWSEVLVETVTRRLGSRRGVWVETVTSGLGSRHGVWVESVTREERLFWKDSMLFSLDSLISSSKIVSSFLQLGQCWFLTKKKQFQFQSAQGLHAITVNSL